MATDFTKSANEVIVQLINDENGRNFSVDDLDLNSLAIAPDPVSGRDYFNNVRTSLKVNAIAQSGYVGEVGITYNRVHLRDVFPTTDAVSVRYPVSSDSYTLGNAVNLSDFLDAVSAKHAINITPSDIFDMPLPTFEGPPPYDPAYVRLEMQGGHKVFVGGVYLRVLPNGWDLNSLQYTELNGLMYPNDSPETPVPQAWLDVKSQLTYLGRNDWNYQTKDPGDGTTPLSLSAFNSLVAIKGQMSVMSQPGFW
jgi:hypothetical protein